MCNFFSVLFFIGLTIFSFGQTLIDGGEYLHSQQNDQCLTGAERARIKINIDASIAVLGLTSTLISNKTIPQFIWPVQQAPGFDYEDIWGISNHVDHNFSTPNLLLDYYCGTRTYDLSSGYNHQGMDIYLWPFSRNQQNEGQADVVAAADGIIVYKTDGNFDEQCSFVPGANWNAVYVQHSDGSVAWYGHMKNGSLTSKLIGASVVAGEPLGKVGSSGQSTGPHLHFEVYDDQNNLIDPYSGPCNNMNAVSWWASQKSYYNPNINTIMTHHSPPQFNTCPALDGINDTDHFAPSVPIYFAIYLRDQEIGTIANFTLYDPGGSVYNSWNKTFSNNYYSSYWYWNLTNLATVGEWTYEVEYLGQVVSHQFNVGVVAGVENSVTEELNIYPNPFESKIQIEGISFKNKNYTFYLIDLAGREVLKGEVSKEINLPESVLPGSYILSIKDENSQDVLIKKMTKIK
jgi:murein DD-endopeptidase MepM/ murein hydrolase activator NlpD